MVGRPYQAEHDLGAATRIWREAGWIDDSDAQAAALADVLAVGSTVVADLNGSPECVVQRAPGSVRYGQGSPAVDLSLATITFELLHFLKVWLTRHINEADKRFGSYFVEAGGASKWSDHVEQAMKKRKWWWKFW